MKSIYKVMTLVMAFGLVGSASSLAGENSTVSCDQISANHEAETKKEAAAPAKPDKAAAEGKAKTGK